ncbi:uncharacterized protein LOC129770625 isoform X2 [Toxorhynchites rutilus septentrionalis]|uniref:uncharacterized protein LOC129770625 isoform X2 n=1 Tax=Toxorhynchites rutilus septentrionalis TaxID=329112 RepID=UPI00247961C1|nr:uncharacterized protein LOC129770625 isoform X2 [Toxorhynchites rutilus septentrionalis]
MDKGVGKDIIDLDVNEYDPSESVYFTEDNLAVNTLYVSFNKFPGVITEGSMRNVFGHFGPIKRIQVGTRQMFFDWSMMKHIYSFAFISYETCEDAARCLQQRNRMDQYCYTTKADSWHQDSYDDNYNTFNYNYSDKDPHVSNIQQLNDDCLTMIFKLVNLVDLVALKRTSTRFHGIVDNLFKRRKECDFNKEACDNSTTLTLLQTRDIFIELGPHVRQLYISLNSFTHPRARILKLISSYCKKLKILALNEDPYSDRVLKPTFRSILAARGVTITGCEH